jgi:hypothetical protein
MDGGFSGPVNVQYFAVGTAGQQYVLKPADVFGTFRREGGTKVYKLQKAGATVTAKTLIRVDTTDATGEAVVPTAAAVNIPIGVAPIAVTSGNYFWMQVSGIATVTCKTGVAAGDPISSSATAGAGQKAPFTAATVQGVAGVALQATGGGDTDIAVRLHGLM